MEKRNALQPHWKRILLGAGTGFLSALVMAAAVAAMVSREAVGIEWIDGSAAVVLILSAFLAGKTAGMPLDGVLAVLGELVVLLALNITLFDGKMEGIGVTALALFGGCGAALLIKGSASRGRKRPRRKRKS